MPAAAPNDVPISQKPISQPQDGMQNMEGDDPPTPANTAPSQPPTPAPAMSPEPHLDTILIKQPLEFGTKAPCKWRDADYQECEIIDRRLKPGTAQYEYYVHFTSFNRRLDEWVTFDRFDIDSLSQAESRRLARKAASERANIASRAKHDKKRKEPKRRRLNPIHAHSAKKELPTSSGPLTKAAPQKNTANDRKHDEVAKVKNIHKIVIGAFSIDTWYYSPFPPEYSIYSTLYFCEFCLKFVRSEEALNRHCNRCILRHPPGLEIYRKDNISVFEVDGANNRIYCQNLCYIAKLFLDHKTLYYDVDPFWFYIMCEVDNRGAHIVGYFSKEKFSDEDFNVACILTLPPYQRRGYGKFLISFSYELSKLENLVGSPEKPLSDLGLLGYRSYWSQVLVDLLRSEESTAISIYSISQKTMMKTEDIVGTLQALNLIQYYEGQHIIDMRRVNNMKMGSRGLPCDSSRIRWKPHTTGPGVVIPPSTTTGPSVSRWR